MIKTSMKGLQQVAYQLQTEKASLCKEDVESVALYKAKKGLYADLLEYFKSYDWIKKEEYKEKIRVYVHSKFDASVLEKQYELSPEAARNTISYANNLLKAKMGKDTLNLLIEGKVEQARLQFETASGKIKLESMMLPDAYQLLAPVNDRPVDLTTVETDKVVKFLQIYSVEGMKQAYDKLDKGSQQYIRYILEGKSTKHLDFLSVCLGVMQGTLTYKEYLEKKTKL